LILNR